MFLFCTTNQQIQTKFVKSKERQPLLEKQSKLSSDPIPKARCFSVPNRRGHQSRDPCNFRALTTIERAIVSNLYHDLAVSQHASLESNT